jgi:hypothetical protein
MNWTPPLPPTADNQSRIAYWQSILAIPSGETGAEVLKQMANERLAQLMPADEPRVEHPDTPDPRNAHH